MMTGVVGAVVIGAIIIRKPAASRPPAPSIDMGAPPIAGRTVANPSAGGAIQDLVSVAGEGVWTRVDPKTGKVAFRMTWTRLDPLDAGKFDIVNPRAWMYDGGRVIEMTAEHAHVIWPSRESEPESGTLTGGVIVNTRDEAASEADPPQLAIRTPNLTFETILGELRTSERVDIAAPGVVASGQGMTLRLGSDPARPIDLFRVEQGGSLTYNPAEARAATRTPRDPAAASPGEPSTQSPAEALQHYRATVVGAVDISAGPRTLQGQTITLWARTRGGSLADDAIADFTAPSAAGSSTRSAASSAEPSQRAPELVTATWTGALEFIPLDNVPDELAEDDVLLRIASAPAIEAAPASPVALRDTSTGGQIKAISLEYAATRRVVYAEGAAAGDRRLAMDLPELASMLGQNFTIDLTTGDGAFDGPGRIDVAQRKPTDKPRSIQWSERGTFALDTTAGPIGAGSQALPRDVRFFGSVEARDGIAFLKGRALHAEFDVTPVAATPSDTAARTADLRRLRLLGDAHAGDARGGVFDADEIDVIFEHAAGTNDPTPTLASAKGNVRAARKGESLEAGSMDTRLERNIEGDVIVRTVAARDNVRTVIDRGGNTGTLRVQADRLDADTLTGVIDLVGEPVTLARHHTDTNAELTGGSARIESDPAARKLTIFGPGAATYSAANVPSQGPSPVIADDARIQWQGSLIYDDAAGRAEILGAPSATLDRGPAERYAARGEKIIIDITPAPPGEPAPERRDLIRARIESGDAPAEIELRRFVASAHSGPEKTAEPILEAMAFLRGPSIELQAQSTLVVSGAGLLLIEDRRPSAKERPAAPENDIRAAARDARGTTLVEWDESLAMNRATGIGEVRGNVRIRQRHADQERIAEITSDTLAITIREEQRPAAGENAMTLIRAEASGNVSAVYADATLEGERLIYDAAAGTISAIGDAARPATGYDKKTGRSASAVRVTIDLATGDWRAEETSTITAPR